MKGEKLGSCISGTGGNEFKVTILDAVAEQPKVVTVTVYVPAALIVTIAFVPSELLHTYVPPPVAERLVDEPGHIAAVAGEIEGVGIGFTVTEILKLS